MESIEASDIDELILNLLNLNLSFQGLNKAFESKFNLSIVQWAFLKALIQMPAVSPQALARALHVTPGTLTQTANRLEKRNYIFICSDPKDARKKMISMTREGKNILESTDQALRGVFRPFKDLKREVLALEKRLDDTLKVVQN